MANATAEPRISARRRGGLRVDAVVVGAGPYGLACASHLRAAGLDVAVFGEPLVSWERHMPSGMLLRSRREASNIADPGHALGLDRFESESGLPAVVPVPLDRFIAYGRWFCERAVPDVDARRVVRVDHGFTVELEDGEVVEAERVVVAAGILPFARKPAVFDGIRAVSHTADHDDLSVFQGRRVAVVGAGQSALESAAILAESGAAPEVLSRRAAIRWLADGGDTGADGRRHYAYRRIALGGPRSSWLIAAPALWRHLPFERRERLAADTIGPAGSGWLRKRLEGLPLTTAAPVLSASVRGGRVVLELPDARREVDHVLLATGYEVDVGRYDFLPDSLLRHVRRRGGYPFLDPGFETSLPGLHFVGAPAAMSLGPVFRFVCGTWAAARGVTRGVVGRGAPRAGFSW